MIRRLYRPAVCLALVLLAAGPATAGIDDVCCALPDGRHETLAPRACAEARGEATDAAHCTLVCCDDAAGRRTRRSLAACVADDGVPVDVRTCLGCCVSADGAARAADPDRCLEDGGAIGPAALCEDTCCRVGADGSAHHETLSGITCRQAGGDPVPVPWCAPTLCCRFVDADGVLTVDTHPPGVCFDLEGEPVHAELCEPVCCPLPTAPPTVEATTVWDCRMAGAEDWTPMPDDRCAEVCCAVGDRTFAATAGSCRGAGGAAVDAARCDAICCALDAGFDTVTAAVCAAAGGAPAPADACRSVCCAADDDALVEVPATDCHGPVPDAWCAPRCCEIAPGEYVSAIGDCPGASAPVSMAACAGVCCQAPDGAVGLTSPRACADGGGEPVDDGACMPTCCALPDGGYDLMPIGTCRALGGPPVALVPEQCAAACCRTRGGYSVASVAECTRDLAGEPLPEAQCTPVCCVGLDDTIVPAAECRGPVRPVEQCDAVCCARDGTVQTTTSAECLPEGQIVDAARCDTVCCRDGSDATTTDSAHCLAGGGEVAPAAWCREAVCCLMDGASPILGSRERCTEAGGDPAGADRCDPVCCALDDDVMTVASIECVMMQGEVVADERCAVCCKVEDAEFVYLPADRCVGPAVDGQVVEAALCDEPGCCALPDGTAVWVATSQCPVLGGNPAPDDACDAPRGLVDCNCRAGDDGPGWPAGALLLVVLGLARRRRSA